ncbi:MAG: MoxR family ATPase [Chloroflexota bacterium]|nr:MoxR family ATPase [Chloroflexota bacterium]
METIIAPIAPAVAGAVPPPLDSVDAVVQALEDHQYVADRGLATSIFLGLRLPKPLLLEGEAGVGKTEVAKTLAAITGAPLIRLQCYEGLDVAHAVYEWDYSRQMLHIRLMEARGAAHDAVPADIFGPQFLIKRPLLQALETTAERPPVLLIDELDRGDDEFDAFLLELLSDWQVTIPEIGTVRATKPPIVVITSNRTRELHDALKRRCLYHWIDYPSLEKELQIVATRLPGTPERLARQVCAFIQAIRRHDLWKVPGVAETLDWTSALLALGVEELSQPEVTATLGCILKHQDDVQRLRTGLFAELLTEVTESSPIPAEPGVVVRDTPGR